VTEQRAAQRMLTKRTDRVILVLDNIHDPRVELAAMQCADYLGVLRIWRVEDEDGRTEPSPRPNGQPSTTLRSDSSIPEQLHVETFSSQEKLITALRRAKIPLWVMSAGDGDGDVHTARPSPSPRQATSSGRQGDYPAIPLDSPHLPPPSVPRVALVLGDRPPEHIPHEKLCAVADLCVCLPRSHGFAEGLPLPGAVALALQAVLQHFPKDDDEALFYDGSGHLRPLPSRKGLCHPKNNCCFLPNQS